MTRQEFFLLRSSSEGDLSDKGKGDVTTEAEIGAMRSQGMLAACRSWKRQGIYSPQSLRREYGPANTSILI